MLSLKTIIVSDANAAPTDEEHTASLAGLFQVFSDVYATDEVVTMLGNNTQTDTVAAE